MVKPVQFEKFNKKFLDGTSASAIEMWNIKTN